MDARRAFLESATSFIVGVFQLASYRIVGNTALLTILDVNLLNRDQYKDVHLPAISELRKVSPHEFRDFDILYHESSMIFAYSILESFLSEVEEVLFLNDPKNVGENIQIKFGKVLSATSIDQLVHDIVRKRVRERSQWSVASRLSELQEQYKLGLSVDLSDVAWLSETRNNIIHNRRHGAFEVKGGAVTYKAAKKNYETGRNITERFLAVASIAVVDLYRRACSSLGVTRKHPRHRANLAVADRISALWPRDSAVARQTAGARDKESL